jgi:hypothetical protein
MRACVRACVCVCMKIELEGTGQGIIKTRINDMDRHI